MAHIYAIENFPRSVLQAGVKMTKEPPKGLRANLKSVYYVLDDDKLTLTNKPRVYMKMLFGLCFFHALIQERRKFGALGWNIHYEFNDTDLDICMSQLELYLNKYEEPPYEVLNVLTSYINYGGRVTDAIDMRTIDVILKDFYCPDAMIPGYQFSPSGIYFTIDADEEGPHQSYIEYIEKLPVNADPEIFGMHDNANITCALAETYTTFDTLMLLQPRSSSGAGRTREQVIGDAAQDIERRAPDIFNIEDVSMRYPVRYEESMNTVLVQECIRYQKLLIEVKKTLVELQKALKGMVVLSSELEAMGDSIYNQKIPAMWEALAYPCLKPLQSWVVEFLDRLNFIQKWIDFGNPPVYWLSGFFFPQAFLTGTLQNFARANQLPIDTISFDSVYKDESHEEITEKPDQGCYIYGLFLEGAKWDKVGHCLADSDPKVLYTSMPVIHFNPIHKRPPRTENVYRCPLYKTLLRAGTLSTTGHSTNYVMHIDTPSCSTPFINNNRMVDDAKWVKAGVASFCSLKF